jgi:hypothetical protein
MLRSQVETSVNQKKIGDKQTDDGIGAIYYEVHFKLKNRIVFVNILGEFIEGYEAWTKYRS